MKDVSGVKWAVPGAHVGGFGPLFGRQDPVAAIPDSFSPTPGNTPEPAPDGGESDPGSIAPEQGLA